MSRDKEYEIDNGSHYTSVNRERGMVIINERGGWGRSYQMTFNEIIDHAKAWNVKFSIDEDDQTVAEIATNIHLANHAASHGLDPFTYVQKTEKVTHPKDIETIKNFEQILKNYKAEEVISLLSPEARQALVLAASKENSIKLKR